MNEQPSDKLNTLYANARAHIESKLSPTECRILSSLMSHQWKNGFAYGQEFQKAQCAEQLNAANETIGELRAEIELLTSATTPKDDEPQIVAGSWWRNWERSLFAKVVSADPLQRTVVAGNASEYDATNTVTEPIAHFLGYFTPCDPPEWAPKDPE